MELILFGNSISLFNLAAMTFLYIFTISVALCGTITVDDIKSIISLSQYLNFYFTCTTCRCSLKKNLLTSKKQ